MNTRIYILALLLIVGHWSVAQIGIGTTDPDRKLEVSANHSSYIRVHVNNNFIGTAGLELVRGGFYDPPADWQIVNDAGTFKILSGNYNQFTSSEEHLRVTTDHMVGIGLTSVHSQLHIGNGEDASLLLGDGYLMLGSVSGTNLIMDNNEIQVRNNGSAAGLYIQSSGGDTYFNSNGGNISLGAGSAKFGIGTTSPPRRLSIATNDWHMYLNNNGSSGGNDWYIGASSGSWAVGDNQLVFSPTTSSSSSKFRLRDVAENDGIVAPVSILSGGGQEMLIDGNEIESTGGPLYINNNSEQETYISPSGGQVSVGTTTLNAGLNIYAPIGQDPLSIQNLGSRWDINPQIPNAAGPWGALTWYHNDTYFASVSGYTGNWFSISDQRRKTHVERMPDVLDRITDIGVYRYSFKSDETDRRYIGVMAQEIQSLFPETVRQNKHQTGVAYAQLAVIVLKAIQEQQKIIRALEDQIAQQGVEPSSHRATN